MKRLSVLVLILGAWAGGAHAQLTRAQLSQVQAAPPPGAAAPLDLAFLDERGAKETLRQALNGKPGVLVFADYRCTYLCGPGLVLTAGALDRSGLKPGRDYSLVVVGLDPHEGPAEARAFRAQRLHPGAGASAVLLSQGPANRVASALGYRYLYDAASRQYAHDASVYVLDADGRARSLLPELALTPVSLHQAVGQAKQAQAPDLLSVPIRLVCYCLSPLTGAFDMGTMTALRVGGAAMVGALAIALLLLHRRREGRR